MFPSAQTVAARQRAEFWISPKGGPAVLAVWSPPEQQPGEWPARALLCTVASCCGRWRLRQCQLGGERDSRKRSDVAQLYGKLDLLKKSWLEVVPLLREIGRMCCSNELDARLESTQARAVHNLLQHSSSLRCLRASGLDYRWPPKTRVLRTRCHTTASREPARVGLRKPKGRRRTQRKQPWTAWGLLRRLCVPRSMVRKHPHLRKHVGSALHNALQRADAMSQRCRCTTSRSSFMEKGT